MKLRKSRYNTSAHKHSSRILFFMGDKRFLTINFKDLTKSNVFAFIALKSSSVPKAIVTKLLLENRAYQKIAFLNPLFISHVVSFTD